jgi:hypothetical protein
MSRFAFINIPSQELERPPAAAAALSACVRSVGWDCKVFDFNLFLNKNVNSNTWTTLEQYWRCKSLSIEPAVRAELERVFDLFIQDIKDYAPDMLGLSVFTRMSVVPAWEMLQYIRPRIDCKILIGGNGAYSWYTGGASAIKTTENKNKSFSEFTKSEGLIDYYIHGDGEVAIMELLKGNFEHPGINGTAPEQIKDLSVIPYPDYQGIEPKSYFYTHEPGIYITASRGCVRDCTFCNVPQLWPKFQSRTADDVVGEIIRGKKQFDTNVFHFTDSLLNGNMKTWREINRQLIAVKEADTSLEPIRYLGQFICRTRLDQTERDWELMARAGADLLVTGFESYSPNVRKHMGKHYSNADIDFHFAQSAKHGIKNVCLMFVGYPTETLSDHEYNIEFLHRYRRYARAGVIHMVRWGYTGMFHSTSKLQLDDQVKMTTDPSFANKLKNLPKGIKDIALGFGWINEMNPELTLKERIRRRLELHELSVKLGWPQTRSKEELQILYNILSNLNSNSIQAQDFETLETLLDFH